jgi:hypothetical protein
MLAIFFAGGAMAEDAVPTEKRGTKSEAVALVKRAVSEFKAVGADKAFAEFSAPKGPFMDRDLYILAYDSSGVCLAHGANQRLIGRNRMDEQDADGVYFVKERLERMKTEKTFWQKYKFTDPLTHKILPKSVYCEVVYDTVLKDFLICAGVYDDQS